MPDPKNNLRAEQTSFVGRAEELEELDDCLGNSRLVTIVGAGGAGKTRLSKHYGLHTKRFDEVWFCGLVGARDPEDYAFEVAEAIGLDMTHSAAASVAIRQLGGELAGRGQVLLILDNLEQALDSAAEVLEVWLEEAPNVTFLATSREPLRLRAEVRFDLQPLDPASAIELFEVRARRVRRTFEANGSTRDVVAKLIERLGALPLAIELAACRIKVLPPATLLEQLDASISMLKRNIRDGTDRHQTMEATLQWSWELLEPVERALLAEATVFRGGFTLPAAEAILLEHRDVSVVDMLETLVNKSLLYLASSPHEVVRFDMFEPIRQFAAARLDDEQRESVERVHASFYIDQAEDGRGRKAQREVGNVEAAYFNCAEHHPQLAARAALAFYRLLRSRGLFRKIFKLVDHAMQLAIDDGVVEAKLLGARAICQLHLGRQRHALVDANAGLALMDDVSDPQTRAFLDTTAASIYRAMGRPSDARAPLEEALREVKELKKPRLEGMVRGNLGLVHFDTGRIDAAADVLREVRDLAHKHRLGRLQAYALQHLARAELERGHYQQAEALLGEAAGLTSKTDRVLQLQQATIHGHLELARGREEGARARFRQGIEDDSTIGGEHAHIPLLFGLSLIGSDPEAVGEASSYLTDVLDILRDTDDAFGYVQAHVRLGARKLRDQDFEAARWHLSTGVTHSPGLEDKRIVAWSHAWLAIAWAGLGHKERAEACIEEARERFEQAAVGAKAMMDDLGYVGEVVDICLAGVPAQPARVRAIATDLREASRARRDDATSRIWLWTNFDHREELAKILEAVVRRLKSAFPEHGLQVERGGGAFIPPRDERVDLSQRDVLKRIVGRLAELRDSSPGSGLSVDDLLEVGWPDEVLTADSGAARVYTAIRTLRSLGLDEIIQTGDDGYLLDPTLALHWIDE